MVTSTEIDLFMIKKTATAPVWISANPSFKCFERRIIQYLSRRKAIAYWSYAQTLDEASSLDVAVELLHDYLKSKDRAIDLIGHGTGGLLGLLYARKYPHRVRSLTLLGVGAAPAIDWQAHYYQTRKLLPCSQEVILTRMVQMMFGNQTRDNIIGLVKILQQDLDTAPTSHSLYQLARIESSSVSMPMMVCGSHNDSIVNRVALQEWSNYLKPEDRLWMSPEGHHFFHYFFPKFTGRKVIEFWQDVECRGKYSKDLDISEKICCHYF